MTTVSKDAKLITFINVFAVDPANQSRLVDLLTKVTDAFVRHARGFVSASLHRSLDGTKVTMYAQWRSLEDYEAMRKDPGPLPYLQEALTIAKFEPGMYEVVASFTPPPWTPNRVAAAQQGDEADEETSLDKVDTSG
jgi:quinol monooxygenase YgiN